MIVKICQTLRQNNCKQSIVARLTLAATLTTFLVYEVYNILAPIEGWTNNDVTHHTWHPDNKAHPQLKFDSHSNGNRSYPNFVFILADDMGWGDTSYNGGTAYTPFLDSWTRMANTITFWRGYAGAPICSPSRASVLSGRTANRECVYNPNSCGHSTWKCNQEMPFPNTTFTVADAVKFGYNGYKTAFFGKWHLGDLWRKTDLFETKHIHNYGMCNPSMVGFDYFLATQAAAPTVTPNCACFKEKDCVVGHYSSVPCSHYWYPDIKSPTGVSNINYRIPGDDTTYLVDQFEKWLHDQSKFQPTSTANKSNYNYHYNNSTQLSMKQPFLALLFVHPVHAQFIATDEWREACANGTSCPLQRKEYTSVQLDYFGSMSSMDNQIKRIRDILLKYNALNNTMIWFTSDNGPSGKKYTVLYF